MLISNRCARAGLSGLVAACLACEVLANGQSEWSSQKPDVLECMESRRAELRTARIEYAEVDQRQPTPSAFFYSWQAAGDRYAREDFGNLHGIDPSQTASERATQRTRLLFTEEGVWRHVPGWPTALVGETAQLSEAFGLFDVRRVGTDPLSIFSRGFEAALRDYGYEPPTYRVVPDRSVHRVDARSGTLEVSWWIDTERGCNAVRMAVRRDGAQVSEQRVALAQYDGHWFPERVEFFGSRGPDTPMLAIRILRAELNRPEHQPALSPSNIGVEIGTSITFTNPPRSGYWDGQAAVSHDEYVRRVQSGEVRSGTSMFLFAARNMLKAELGAGERATPGGTASTHGINPADLTEWQRYTAAFITRHQLTADQAERALAILRDCENEAQSYLSRRAADIEAVGSAPDPHATPEQKAQQDRARAKLLEPVSLIFERRLKPRLDGLLTTEQAKQAASSTQPAKNSP